MYLSALNTSAVAAFGVLIHACAAWGLKARQKVTDSHFTHFSEWKATFSFFVRKRRPRVTCQRRGVLIGWQGWRPFPTLRALGAVGRIGVSAGWSAYRSFLSFLSVAGDGGERAGSGVAGFCAASAGWCARYKDFYVVPVALFTPFCGPLMFSARGSHAWPVLEALLDFQKLGSSPLGPVVGLQ